MTEIVPHGYISAREAVDRLGRELFSSEWTGEEYKARRGLISENEWLKIKDLAPGAWRWCTRQCTRPDDYHCAGCYRPASDRRSFHLFLPSGVQGA